MTSIITPSLHAKPVVRADEPAALEIDKLRIRYGGLDVVHGVSITAKRGGHLTLVGPSGCGKTTILRSIAGLETPYSGTIRLFGRPVYDAASDINLPTEKREVSMVFQTYAIWPHMTVFDNVAYGLKLRRVPKAETKDRVMTALSLVGLEDFAMRPAPMLSGGQQQRVALARSFVFDPKILLFDEPLSNLDAKLRAQMRVELMDLTTRVGITAVYVTHDQEEALSMSDQVVVLQGGHVQQDSAPLDAYFSPANRFVADFMGQSNILTVQGTPKVQGGGLMRATLGNGAEVVCSTTTDGGPWAALAIKAAHLQLRAVVTAEDRKNHNVWDVTVRQRFFVGDLVEYHLDWQGIEIRARALSAELFDVGASVHCVVKPALARLVGE